MNTPKADLRKVTISLVVSKAKVTRTEDNLLTICNALGHVVLELHENELTDEDYRLVSSPMTDDMRNLNKTAIGMIQEVPDAE